jgi:hypothetical protein
MINKKLFKSNGKVSAIALAACISASIFSHSALATVTLYEKNGLKYKLKADWQIQLEEDVTANETDLDLAYDDLELKNIIQYDLGNGMTAFGEVHFSFDNAGNKENRDTTRLEEAFVGFDFGDSKLTFGKTNSAGDEFGIEKAYEKVGVAEDGFEEVADKGDDLIRLDTKIGNFTIASSMELEADGTNADSTDGSFVDLFVSTKLGNLKLAAAFMDYSENPASGSNANDADVSGVSLSYKGSNFDIGADYSTVEYVNGSELDITNLAVGFKISSLTNIGVGINSQKPNAGTNVDGWYGNVTYKFPKAKNVRLFGEVGTNDGDNVDVGYVVGMRILL